MLIFPLIALLNEHVVPRQTKLHLATWNGSQNPLDVYLDGGFYEWQRWQSRKNFERNFVLSMIALPAANQWLFAGVHRSAKVELLNGDNTFYYPLAEVEELKELNGRLTINFERPGRQSYLNADTWFERLRLAEIQPEKLTISDFPGYRKVNLTKQQLDLIVRDGIPSWKAALSAVAGVYLISDTISGKLYVGSAYGDGGIWQRWVCYSMSGHGGNLQLAALLKSEGTSRAAHFRFAVLEIADTHASPEDIRARESHWKQVLLSRDHGLNSN